MTNTPEHDITPDATIVQSTADLDPTDADSAATAAGNTDQASSDSAQVASQQAEDVADDATPTPLEDKVLTEQAEVALAVTDPTGAPAHGDVTALPADTTPTVDADKVTIAPSAKDTYSKAAPSDGHAAPVANTDVPSPAQGTATPEAQDDAGSADDVTGAPTAGDMDTLPADGTSTTSTSSNAREDAGTAAKVDTTATPSDAHAAAVDSPDVPTPAENAEEHAASETSTAHTPHSDAGTAVEPSVAQVPAKPQDVTDSDAKVPAKPQDVTPQGADVPAKLGAAKPSTAKPGGVKPSAIKPSAIKPSAIKPGSIKPGSIKPNAVKPAAGGGGSKPAAKKAAPAAEVPVAPVVDIPVGELAERGRQHGRIDEDQNVYVRDGETEHNIGSYPGVPEDEALAYFVRKYDEIVAQFDLIEARLTAPSPVIKEIAKSLRSAVEHLNEPKALGDFPALRERAQALEAVVAQKKAEFDELRAQAKEAALKERDAIVAKAEKLAAKDPSTVQWKQASEQMRGLFDEWKEHQKSSARLDKPVEDELWQRFRDARTSFDKQRKAYFDSLNEQRDQIKALKEKIIEEAEKLADSTDWGATAGAFKRLMTDWKSAGRAGRKDDDKLWDRFKAAQDRFFEARNELLAEQDKEFEGNLAVKEELLVKAEALVPVKDVQSAKNALRKIGEQWDEAGKVPRKDMARIEGRMRAVEQAVRDADESQWKSKNPEGKARAEGLQGQLEDSIKQLEDDLAAAQAAGNPKAVKLAEDALAARRAWLEQIEKALGDFS